MGGCEYCYLAVMPSFSWSRHSKAGVSSSVHMVLPSSSSVFKPVWLCCLNLKPACQDEVCSLLEVLMAAPQLILQLCVMQCDTGPERAALNPTELNAVCASCILTLELRPIQSYCCFCMLYSDAGSEAKPKLLLFLHVVF